MDLAPIILFTYKRLDTLVRCVESLQRCTESSGTDLIIISDYPNKESDQNSVKAVREYLRSVDGFKTVEIIERERNYGVDYNIIEGLQMMQSRFEQFVVVEDDLVVGAGFLRFLNTSLELYADNDEVLSVSAFSFVKNVPNDYNYDGYFAKRTNPWGWATWSHKIKEVDWEMKDKGNFMNSPKIQSDFNKWGSDRSSMLKGTINGVIRAWDIRMDYFQFMKDSCTLYPVINLVENIGFGRNDASNTFGYNRYATALNDGKKAYLNLPKNVFYNKNISKSFISKNSISQRVYSRLMKYYLSFKFL